MFLFVSEFEFQTIVMMLFLKKSHMMSVVSVQMSCWSKLTTFTAVQKQKNCIS